MTSADLRALWALARPTMAPLVAAIPLVGFYLAHWDRALALSRGHEMLAVMGAWMLLHAGTLWLNAVLDRDEGEVFFGRAAPVPRAAAPAGYCGLAACVALAWTGGAGAGLCALGCAILAVLYSHPRLAWKG